MTLQHPAETLTRKSIFPANQLMPIINGKITVAAGEGKLLEGALLTAEGKLCGKTAAAEGTTATADEVFAVLAEDVDATTEAVEAPCYYTGEFRAEALSCKTDNDANVGDFALSARKVSIFIRPNL